MINIISLISPSPVDTRRLSLIPLRVPWNLVRASSWRLLASPKGVLCFGERRVHVCVPSFAEVIPVWMSAALPCPTPGSVLPRACAAPPRRRNDCQAASFREIADTKLSSLPSRSHIPIAKPGVQDMMSPPCRLGHLEAATLHPNANSIELPQGPVHVREFDALS